MNRSNYSENGKMYSILDYLEPKYPGNGQGSLSSGKTGNSKPLVIATPTSTVNPIPPLKHLKDENKFRDNITVSQRQVQQARKVSLDHHGSKQPMIEPTARKESSTNPPNGALFNKTTSGANKTITAASTEDAKRDDLDFFVCLEREEHNRKLHEQEQSKWSFLTKRKTSPVEFGDKHDSYNHSSGYYKGNGGSYYNDKRSRYTDDDKWTAQLEQLRAEKDSARQHKFAGGNVYDLTHDDDICFDDPYGFARNDQVGRGLTDSAYYSSGMTDMYSVGRAQASFLDANYSNPPQKKPEQSKSDDAPSNKVILDIYQYAKKSGQCDSNIPAANPTAAPVTNAFLQNFNIMYQTQLLNTDLCSGKDLDALINSSIDSICVEMLKLNLAEVLAYEEQREGGEGRGRHMATHVPPLSFLDVNSYISFFQPLLIEEFKAALISYILDIHGDEKQEHSVVDSIPSGSHKTSTIREFGSVEVRPEVISQRGTESKLHEVHLRVRRQEDRSVDFIKDELVLITNQRIPDSIKTKRQLVKERHFLGIVLSSTSRRSQTAKTFSVLVNKKHQHDIDKDQKTTWTCVSMFNLSSFLREWHALLSMKHMQSFPLAGYLLNGSQVVSAAQLASLSESLVAKLRALEIGLRHKAPADRLNVLENSVAKELQNLLEIKVNVALLKFTNIGKEIKHIVKNKDGFYPNSVVGLAENVMASWTGIIKAQEKSSIMRTKKGGKIMEIPEDVALLESSVIAKDLWASLRSMYNRSQLFAIHYTLEQFKTLKDIGVVLVQGPPGTGKTSTIIGMLSALLQTPLCISPDQQTESASSRRILVCAPSNTAIDEVVGRLATQGIIANQPGESKRNGSRDVPRMQVNIVRLGDTQQADAAVQATVLDEQVEQRVRKDALYLQHVRLNDSIAEQENRLHELGVRRQTVTSTFISSHVDTEQQGVAKKKTEYEKCKDAIQELCRQRTQCERALDRLRLDTRHDVLQSADIICTTLSSSNKQHFLDYVLKEQISFNTVIIDEAAQTTEISTLIPLRLGCRHLVLIGDPRQLPATVLSRAAQAGGLGRSLFERLESLEHEVVMLTTQYRMHPEIRQFPSDYFYQGLLQDADIVQEEVRDNCQMLQLQYRGRVTSSTLYRLRVKPVMFLHLNGMETRRGTSFVNEDEGRAVLDLLRGLVRQNVHKEESIAVITPYKAQVKRIKRRILQDSLLSGVASSLEVNSIDGFQGRERDIIIFSAVRSGVSHNGSIGFVADERRLNVAITRARKALVIFGNQQTLSIDPVWRAMIRVLLLRGLLFPEVSALRHLLQSA